MKGLFQIALCAFCLCFTVSLTLTTNFLLLPKWMKTLPNESFKDIPKSVTQLQNLLLYPTRQFLMKMFNSQTYFNRARRLQRTQRLVSKSTKFYCSTNSTRSSTRPTSVHELRPGDIDVIGSIGDSLTSGTGSFSYFFPQLLVDHRGVSFSGGGQGTWREFLTLPNILKMFNPKLVGYALGDSLAENRASQFNVAEPGALSQDLPYMTRELVKRIKNDRRVDINNDWKLVTILMGSNTFCLELCYDDHTTFVEKHRNELIQALLNIKENLPRTIVNLILSPDLKLLFDYKNLPPHCTYTYLLECPCLFGSQFKRRRPEYLQIMKDFQVVEKEIVELDIMKDKEDFSVVLQVFSENSSIPENRFNSTDMTYLAVDCFHLSQKGYARAAKAFWNNLLQPIGRKSTDLDFEEFLCPSNKSPYIRTWKNSIM